MSHRKSRPQRSGHLGLRSRPVVAGVAATLVVLLLAVLGLSGRLPGSGLFAAGTVDDPAALPDPGSMTATPYIDDDEDDQTVEDDRRGSRRGGGRSGEDDEGKGREPGASQGVDEHMRRYIQAQKRLARQVSEQLDRRSQPVTFRVATFNVLGDSHTGPGGNKPGYPDASARMNMAIGILRSNAVDVVGFQEFESSQYHMFTARAGEYATYPGLSEGDKSVRFNIAWRSSMWSLVEAHTLPVPYAGGNRIGMPVVLLENTETGRRAWFANFHNPADTPSLGSNARWRAIGSDLEVNHLTELHRLTGHPVVVTGDFNERDEIFCKFTAGGVFIAAAGGSNSGSCVPPPRMGVDWVFGSDGVAFDGYAVSGTGLASDHDLVHAQATLLSQEPGDG